MSFEPVTDDELIALWRTLFPPGYTVPIEQQADGQGLDVFAAQAAVAARVAEAVAVTTQAYYLLPHSTQIRPPAAGEARATVLVRISRDGLASGALDLSEGTEVVALYHNERGEEIEGERFTLAAVSVPAGSLGPIDVLATCSRPGYQGNVPAGAIRRFVARGTATVVAEAISATELRDTATDGDRFSPAMIGQFLRITSGVNASLQPRKIIGVSVDDITGRATAVVDGAALVAGAADVDVLEYADVGLLVEQPEDAEGGKHGWLDAIGADRNLYRALAELDDAFRARIAALADVVSPNAIVRAAQRTLTPFGITWSLRETLAELRGFACDHDPVDYGDICDDGQVLLTEAQATTFFVICVHPKRLGDFGLFADADVSTALMVNALDATNDRATNFLDGFPVTFATALQALSDAIEKARAGGVEWKLVIDYT